MSITKDQAQMLATLAAPCPECRGQLRGGRRITYCADCGASWLRPRTTTTKENR